MEKMNTRLILAVAMGLLGTGLVSAGSLDPLRPPAPTMVTLQEIHDLVQIHGGMMALVAKTGQTGCWNAAGTTINCTGTGQDGEYRKGVSISGRFSGNVDGTVRDNLTGLIWLKNANCFGTQTWTNALTVSNSLASGACGLTDGSVAGDWRLPNVRELMSLIDFGMVGPALPLGHPFSNVWSTYYWTSTTFVPNPGDAWKVNLGYGDLGSSHDGNPVWPVRGGQ